MLDMEADFNSFLINQEIEDENKTTSTRHR